ncbi:MAG TPA: hypothetical protein VHM19_09255 [Polyangiales bacterium]|jgi:hypothetical protein|nr:hypothetical protein [Polyangiales bacterium]
MLTPVLDHASARAVLRLSLCVLAAFALAGAWQVFADQAPGSLLYIGVLPGPVESLRHSAFVLGVLTFLTALLVPRAFPERAPRAWLVVLHASVVFALGAGVYGAATGLHGEQLGDLRPDALPLFLVKHAGFVGFALCSGWAAARALWAKTP